MGASDVRAVIFDLGGVVFRSPLIGIARYEESLGLPADYLNVQITSRGRDGAWQRFERGEIHDIRDFYRDFGNELSDTVHGNRAYLQHLAKSSSSPQPPPKLPSSLQVNGRELFGSMMTHGAEFDEYVVEAIHRIRESKRFLLISVTNNFVAPYELLLKHPSYNADPSSTVHPASSSDSTEPPFSAKDELVFLHWTEGPVPPSVRAMFDIFIDSSEVGMRKPERRIYELALQMANESKQLAGELEPGQVVMLDDLGMNLKTAQEIGMKTIRVPIGGTKQAVAQLEEFLQIPLLKDSKLSNLAKL
ncbi:hypothetical protein DL93DRAFT_2213006 [Clavulina sp. PMI_390]|nr:hypothetical protein DL93DRAFT_2213006 [Clavulina sp. PMI_390]